MEKEQIKAVITALKELGYIQSEGLSVDVQKRMEEVAEWTTPWWAISPLTGQDYLSDIDNTWKVKCFNYVFGIGNWTIADDPKDLTIQRDSNGGIKSIDGSGWLLFKGQKLVKTSSGHENTPKKSGGLNMSNGDMRKSYITSLMSKAFLNFGFASDVQSGKRSHKQKPTNYFEIDNLLKENKYIMSDEIRMLENGSPKLPKAANGKFSDNKIPFFKGIKPTGNGTIENLFPIHDIKGSWWKLEGNDKFPMKPEEDYRKSPGVIQSWKDAKSPDEAYATNARRELRAMCDGTKENVSFGSAYLAYLRISASFNGGKDFEDAARTFLISKRAEFMKSKPSFKPSNEIAKAIIKVATSPSYDLPSLIPSIKVLGSKGAGLDIEMFIQEYLGKYAK